MSIRQAGRGSEWTATATPFDYSAIVGFLVLGGHVGGAGCRERTCGDADELSLPLLEALTSPA